MTTLRQDLEGLRDFLDVAYVRISIFSHKDHRQGLGMHALAVAAGNLTDIIQDHEAQIGLPEFRNPNQLCFDFVNDASQPHVGNTGLPEYAAV